MATREDPHIPLNRKPFSANNTETMNAKRSHKTFSLSGRPSLPVRVGLIGVLAVLATTGCSWRDKRAKSAPASSAFDTSAPPLTQPAPDADPASGDDPTTSTPAATPKEEVAAVVNGKTIHKREVTDLLWQGRGLPVLTMLIELAAVENYARLQGDQITAEDIDHELAETLSLLDGSPSAGSGDDPADVRERREAINESLCRSKGIGREEFALTMRRNAYLRKLVVRDMRFDERELRMEFNRLYGPKVEVRHILLKDLRAAQEAKDRLSKREPFESVAEDMSADQSSSVFGGLLKPFTIDDERYPLEFRRPCFDLKPGQISKIVHTPKGWHIIKLLREIPASGVELDLVRDRVEASLKRRRVFRLMEQERHRIMEATNVQINDADLARQYRLVRGSQGPR